jgi:hypothetical protein
MMIEEGRHEVSEDFVIDTSVVLQLFLPLETLRLGTK